MNSIKKAVAIKNDSEEAKPLVSNSNGRYFKSNHFSDYLYLLEYNEI